MAVTTAAELLAAYDDQLRTDAETQHALSVASLGPLRLATLAVGRGFVTYGGLDAAESDVLGQLVSSALAHFRDLADITEVEWKTRGHDHAPGLDAALRDQGFVAQEQESIMVGDALVLAGEAHPPDGVVLRMITEPDDVRAMARMQAEVFDRPEGGSAEALMAGLGRADGMELWVAQADGEIVGAGRMEPVAHSDFAGLWGGATRSRWRGRGIYRALTAARARSAISLGKTLINSDSTEHSRPILERSGLIKVSTTTPYLWRR